MYVRQDHSVLSEVGEQPRALAASLKLATLPRGDTEEADLGWLHLQMGDWPSLGSPPTKTRPCFSKGTRPAGSLSPRVGRGWLLGWESDPAP